MLPDNRQSQKRTFLGEITLLSDSSEEENDENDEINQNDELMNYISPLKRPTFRKVPVNNKNHPDEIDSDSSSDIEFLPSGTSVNREVIDLVSNSDSSVDMYVVCNKQEDPRIIMHHHQHYPPSLRQSPPPSFP